MQTAPDGPKLVCARRGLFVGVGVEFAGRFGNEAAIWLRLLARHRSSTAPVVLRPAARSVWAAHWSGLLAIAAQRAFAATLLELPLAGECNVGGMRPSCTRSVPACAGSFPYPQAVGTALMACRWGSRWGSDLVLQVEQIAQKRPKRLVDFVVCGPRVPDRQ